MEMIPCTFNQRAKIGKQRPALNRKCCFKFHIWKFVCFYESDHAFKTIWPLSCSCYLIKIKRHFFKVRRPVLIIAINTSCSGICFAINARQKSFHNALPSIGTHALFAFLLGINSKTNAPTVGIYSYNKKVCFTFKCVRKFEFVFFESEIS